MKELKTGDRVQLNSGGPEMTVIGKNTTPATYYSIEVGGDEYVCTWFSTDRANFDVASFHPDMLKKIG